MKKFSIRLFWPVVTAGVLALAGAAIPTAEAAAFVNGSRLSVARYRHTATLLPNGKVLVAGGYNGSTLAGCELHDPSTGTWTATGSLITGRYRHSATLLQNGKVLVAGGYGNTTLSSAELYDPATGTWTAIGSMSAVRFLHTATLLPNGKVLIAGGYVLGSVAISGAELYDPVTGAWTVTNPMNFARQQHTATLLPNGKVLVAGGDDGTNPLSSVELYDPTTGTWTPTGALSNVLYQHTATLLPNGKVLVAGGYSSDPAVSNAALYDPATGVWTPTGVLGNGRYNHIATLLPNGKVLVAGGQNTAGTTLFTVELYDPATGVWTIITALNGSRNRFTATLLGNGKVLVAGGESGGGGYLFSVETYDPAVGTWTPTGTLIGTRHVHRAVLLTNGQVLVAGGYTPTSGYLSSAELYHPDTGTWAATGALLTSRVRHTATLLLNGKVLVTGGYNGTYFSSAELYDPVTGAWTYTGSMSTSRYKHTATLLPNGKVLVVGGQNGSSIASAELYDPATGTWSPTGSMSVSRETHTATLLPDGKVVVAGGYNGANAYHASLEVYDPATGSWTTVANMSTARIEHAATLLANGKVLITGGYNDSAGFLFTAEIFNPTTVSFATTGSMNDSRYAHSATLLPNGKVLIAGGQNSFSASLPGAELYDPTTGTWMATAPMNAARFVHTATLLLSGEILVAGGNTGSATLGSSELYDVGLGFSAAWRPQITTFPPLLTGGGSLNLSGNNFRGISGGSGGNTQESTSDNPVVQLRRLDNDQVIFLNATNWSTNAYMSAAIGDLPSGWIMATMFVNGINSTSIITAFTNATSFVPPGILVGPAGYTNSFTTNQFVTDWSTLSVAGVGTDISSIASLNSVVQARSAAIITAPLGNGGVGTPVSSGTAVWGSGGFLQTRPTGNACTLLMGTFVNNTGTNATSIRLRYDFTAVAVLSETVTGHQVYYSMTGQPNSWSNLTTLSGTGSAALSTNVTLPFSWNHGSTLYLLFADDNGTPSPDTANQIDNFSLAVTAGEALGGTTVAITSPAANAVIDLSAVSSIDLAAYAISTNSVVTNVAFYQGAMLLGQDTNAPYTFTWSGMATGTYTLRAVASDNGGLRTTSAPVNITVVGSGIQVGVLGSGTNGFVTLPSVPDWSTFSLQDVNNAPRTDAEWDASMSNIVAAAINNPLAGATVASALPYAYWRSDLQRIVTQPTGNTATLLMAALFNASGTTIDTLNITYVMSDTVSTSEARKGHRVYYSTSGALGGWSAGGNFSVTDAATNNVSISLNSLQWVAGTKMYVVWLDENGISPDGNYGIDDISFTPAPPVPTTVAISNPTNTQNFALGAIIQVKANFSGAVTNMAFLADGGLLTNTTNRPYSFNYNNAPAGAHTLLAVATDSSGLSVTSSPVNIFVVASYPHSITLTSPADNTPFFAPASVTLKTSTAFPITTVTNVSFYANGNLIGSDTVSPFEMVWAGASVGSDLLVAVATDNIGGSATSAPVRIVVGSLGLPIGFAGYSIDFSVYPAIQDGWSTRSVDNSAAIVTNSTQLDAQVQLYGASTINSALGSASTIPPTENAVARWSSTLQALQTRSTGNEFLMMMLRLQNNTGVAVSSFNLAYDMAFFDYVDRELPGWRVYFSLTGAPGSWQVIPALSGFEVNGRVNATVSVGSWAPGAVLYLLWVDDNASGADPSYTMDNFAITVVTPVTGVPTGITLWNPADGQVFLDGDDISLNAITTGSVTNVDFYRDSILIGSATSPPYSVFYYNAAASAATALRAVAKGTNGLSVTSSVVSISVVTNLPPSVSLTSPGYNTTMIAPASLTLAADANDTAGTISKVEFFVDGTKLGEATALPYSLAWNSASPGIYKFFAVATDNLGQTNRSATIVVELIGAGGQNWTAYNDHAAGAGTSPFATTYHAVTYPGGSLWNIADGATLPAELFLTYGEITLENNGVAPAGGTPLYNLFNGRVDFQGDSINLSGAGYVTYAFTNLNPFARYRFSGSAVRGNNAFNDQWTLVEIGGAAGYRAAHSSARVLTGAQSASLGTNQAALQTGVNHTAGTGDYAGWEEIIPSTNGTFFVTSRQYTGAVPGGSSGGANGHGLTGLRLEEVTNCCSTWVTNIHVDPAATYLHVCGESPAGAVPINLAAYGILPGDVITLQQTGAYSHGAGFSDEDTGPLWAVFSSSSVLEPGGLLHRVPGAIAAGPQVITTPTLNCGDPTDIPEDFSIPLTGVMLRVPPNASFLFVSAPDTAFADNTDPDGNYSLHLVKERDVNPPPPAVIIAAPVAGQEIYYGGNIGLVASPFAFAAVTNMRFYVDGILIGNVTNSPYSLVYSNAALGPHTLQAVARNNYGLAVTSGPVQILVVTNLSPSVALTSPLPNTNYSVSTAILLAAAASDMGGSISKVEFYAGAAKLGGVTNSPFSLLWSNAPLGAHTLTAVAYDNLGLSRTSSPVNITVSPNTAPTVAIISPLEGELFAAPGTISLLAGASDSDGTVVSVEFYSGPVLLGTSGVSPFSNSWAGLLLGNYSFHVVAVDNQGLRATSTVVNVSVVVSGMLVGLSGTAINTFETPPTAVDGWTTGNVPGAKEDVSTPAAVDAEIRKVTATNVIQSLPQDGTLPPPISPVAQWNTDGQFIQSRPTGTRLNLLMVKLRNNTGGAVASFDVSYDFAEVLGNVAEEVPGLRAFYSLSGASNSWVAVPALTTGTSGSLTATLNVTNWPAGSALYLLWGDDNASGSEGAYTIDNFAISNVVPLAQPTLTITRSMAGTVTLNWPGTGFTLQHSPALLGTNTPWADVPGPVTTGPFQTNNPAGSRFYRLRP